jgi:hypothetical protein
VSSVEDTHGYTLAENRKRELMKMDIKSDFSAEESMTRFHTALGQAMKVSKITPLAPQKRGPRPSVLARASLDRG